MAISRSDLLKNLLPGLNALFDLEYSKYTEEISIDKHEIEVNFDDTTPVQMAVDNGRN